MEITSIRVFCYFKRFSRVAEFRDVSLTRVNPYSEVSTKDFGRSSQGTTSPSFSHFSKNSRVRLEVEVLSRSKIPMMLLSRTAISLPMDRYMYISLSVGEGQCPSRELTFTPHLYRNNPLPTFVDYLQYTSIFFHSYGCCV